MLTTRCGVTGKQKFDTEDEAKRQAKQYRKSYGPRMSAYPCGSCGCWHIGHYSKNYAQRALRRLRKATHDKTK